MAGHFDKMRRSDIFVKLTMWIILVAEVVAWLLGQAVSKSIYKDEIRLDVLCGYSGTKVIFVKRIA